MAKKSEGLHVFRKLIKNVILGGLQSSCSKLLKRISNELERTQKRVQKKIEQESPLNVRQTADTQRSNRLNPVSFSLQRARQWSKRERVT